MKSKLMILSIATLVAASVQAVPSQYRITDIGVPSLGVSIFAFGLNEQGQIVGRVRMTDDTSKAFKYTNGIFSLLSPLSGGTYAEAVAINEAGTVVGSRYNSNFQPVGFYWKNNQAAVSIPNYAQQSGFESPARDINDAGMIVGYANGIGGGQSPTRAYFYNPEIFNPQLTDMGSYIAGSDTFAQGINASGVATGGNNDPGNSNTAFKKGAGAMQNLGYFTTQFFSYETYAQDINDAGYVVGSYTLTNTARRPFYKTNSSAQGVYVGIGMLPGSVGTDDGYAFAINADGDTVGSIEINNVPHAFLFETTRGNPVTVDLNTKIDGALGWTLYSATDINDKGWIVGYGVKGGLNRSFIMKPTTIVSGKVTLQGWTASVARWASIEIHDNVTNQLLETQFVFLGADGTYSFETDKVGTRKLLFKVGIPFLNKAKTSVNMNNNIANVNVTMQGGDSDGDNEVTNSDYAIWASKNGQSVPAFDNADYDGDGEITNSDYALWASNNGTMGDE